MKHPTSRLLHAYWDRVRRDRAAPERREIEPGAIRNLLSDALILSVDVPAGNAAFRLAGTRVCALFRRELRGADFARLWGEPTADPWRLVEAVAVDTVGMVAGLRGETSEGEAVDLELLLLPLRHRGQTQSRILGALSPQVIPHWLGLRPLVHLSTTSLRVLGPDALPAAPADDVLDAVPEPANDRMPRRRGHLFVHPGGRA
ncbi:PAS domain-containing protein [Methylobacterium sp. Leaf399]|uniref:PAS domain-containing protein n=1 Tax=unclassified Methylobacterium TaxID=2615210 RepID=UPI0006F2DF20|nr:MULTISPECIES: PAS domain-containing protein [unclassified Methylobacterium]KQT07750.1 PAS domain-containing protein [Methylobacterium sp. Leaf399]KQT82131.1 PAS domain-containing protein [Methylobacterium sp. Leaf466]